jgi:hypothetical protein
MVLVHVKLMISMLWLGVEAPPVQVSGRIAVDIYETAVFWFFVLFLVWLLLWVFCVHLFLLGCVCGCVCVLGWFLGFVWL